MGLRKKKKKLRVRLLKSVTKTRSLLESLIEEAVRHREERAVLLATKIQTVLRATEGLSVADVLAMVKHKDDTLEGVKARIKDECRRKAIVGQRVKVWENTQQRVYIHVDGKQGPVEYDWDTTMRSWSGKVLSLVRKSFVDPEAVEECIEGGLLTEKQAQKAALPRKPMTPAVTIRGL